MTTIPPSHESPVEAQTAAALVAHLAERGVRLCAEGTALRVDAPAGVMTEELKAQLVTHKTAVLAVLAQAAVDDSAGRRFPLSYAQERLWFLDQLQPGQPLYVMSWAYHLHGSLDVPALERALGDMVRRHAVLRTAYLMEGGMPTQVVQPAGPFPLSLVDLTHLPPAVRMAEVQYLAQVARDQPFDLTADRMLCAQLLRLATNEHVLLVAVHHIACDGWSMDVFWRELAALYAAHRVGAAVVLSPLPLQYGDYAVWQRRMLAGGEWQNQLTYWQHQLQGLTPLALPYDGTGVTSDSWRGHTVTVTIPPQLALDLRNLARAEGVTLYMLLLAVFQVLLADVCGQDDIAIGTPVAGRDRVEYEGLIGFFTNTLVMRSHLIGSPTFREFLHRVRQTVLAALDHQEFPFDQLVAVLRPARHGIQNPLFQVLFQLVGFDEVAPRLDGIVSEPMGMPGNYAKFDLELLLHERGETLSGRLRYRADLFASATIEQIAERYTGLLQTIVADPDQRIVVSAPRQASELKPCEPVGAASEKRTDMAPLTATEMALAKLWCEVLGLPQVGLHDDFFALGGHSLGAIRLCAAIEQRLGVRVSVATLFRAPTVAQLAAALTVPGHEEWSSVVPIQMGGSRRPFFCVHGFGGGVDAYAALARELGSDQPFYGLQATGVDRRLAPETTIEGMAAHYVSEMRRAHPAGPYCFGGYCFGGIVAYEMARQLIGQGERPALVAIIEGVAPRYLQRRLALHDVRRWQTLWRSLPFWAGEYRALGWARVQRRAQAKLRRQWKRLRQRLGQPAELALHDVIDADVGAAPDYLQALLAVHLRALRQYTPQPCDVRVILFRAQLQTVSRVLFGTLDPEYGWGRLAQRGVDVHEVVAGHRTIHLPPHVSALADALGECLMDVT